MITITAIRDNTAIFFFLSIFFYPVVQFSCREDPLGLPSAEWVQSNVKTSNGIYPYGFPCGRFSMRLTEDPAGLPYNWIGHWIVKL
jgi:hypothetical protein